MQPSTKTLLQTISQLQKVIEFYKYLRVQFDLPPEYNIIGGNGVPDTKTLASILVMSEREVHRIFKLSNTLKQIEIPVIKAKSRVMFKEDGRRFIDFLSCFNFGTSASVGLQKNLSLEKKSQVCTYHINDY